MRKLFFFVLSFIFLVGIVSALGVTPGRSLVDYKEESMQQGGSFKVLNDDSKARELVIQTKGELAKNIRLDERRISFTQTDTEKVITYILNLPSDLSPGKHIGEIVISEEVGSSGDDDTIVGAVLSVVTLIEVFVPYPGKYAEAKLNIKNAGAGEDVEFIIPIVNMGEFDLTKVYANIDLYNDNGEKLDSFNTKTISIPSDGKVDLTHKWKANVPVGSYKAIVTVIYDGESINLEGTFQVGSVSLELQQITVNNFELGQIVKMDLLVQNKWSEDFDGVYTQVQIFSSGGEILADFNSPTEKVPALQKKVLSSYWDTAGVKVGTYDTKVIIHYAGDKTVETNLKLVVKENSLEVIGLGYVLSEDGGDPGSSDTLIVILIIVIGLLILLNLVWFFVLRKALKK